MKTFADDLISMKEIRPTSLARVAGCWKAMKVTGSNPAKGGKFDGSGFEFGRESRKHSAPKNPPTSLKDEKKSRKF